jgi:protein-ribulosamine 3-kinase
MVAGEFASMIALHNAIPDASPTPIAFSTYATVPGAHFYLCTFVDMDDEVPDVHTFTAKVAELHTKGVSPTEKYGFPVPTYMGQMPQYTTWTNLGKLSSLMP